MIFQILAEPVCTCERMYLERYVPSAVNMLRKVHGVRCLKITDCQYFLLHVHLLFRCNTVISSHQVISSRQNCLFLCSGQGCHQDRSEYRDSKVKVLNPPAFLSIRFPHSGPDKISDICSKIHQTRYKTGPAPHDKHRDDSSADISGYCRGDRS